MAAYMPPFEYICKNVIYMKQTIKISAILCIASILGLSSCIKGEEGPAGKNGNANVVGSNEFTAYSNNWDLYSGGSQGSYYAVEVTSPQITDAIAKKGAVICYYKLTDNTWAPLPYDVYSFIFVPGGMAIIYDYNSNPGTQSFRLVTIAASELAKHPEIDINVYNDISDKMLQLD